MYTVRRKIKPIFYQLISSPAIFKSELSSLNTVYSILSVQADGGAAKTALVYDVTRIRSVGERILSEVIKSAPPPYLLSEFISELL